MWPLDIDGKGGGPIIHPMCSQSDRLGQGRIINDSLNITSPHCLQHKYRLGYTEGKPCSRVFLSQRCRIGGSSGRAVGYQLRCPRFDSVSGPSQITIAALCPPSTELVASSLKIRRNGEESNGKLPPNSVC
ncbi:hypothetical protein PoB_003958300 [Plakobranchus ocellatus]|uniref:SUEL-type lectin domain-containing protein n=1 Tax=Plakobranchus ocellatus TaxID=259542 RepID=A0AAV4B2X3_9GAST|nr:hypothetical protein PoB_003958300 [Plakobranchus ocellatus]